MKKSKLGHYVIAAVAVTLLALQMLALREANRVDAEFTRWRAACEAKGGKVWRRMESRAEHVVCGRMIEL